MTKVIFPCDRCKRVIEGLHSPQSTAGFYVVSGESYWSRFAREGEHFVCDCCVQSMPEYQAIYGY